MQRNLKARPLRQKNREEAHDVTSLINKRRERQHRRERICGTLMNSETCERIIDLNANLS